MDLTPEHHLIHLLAEARRANSRSVDAAPYAGIDRATAYRIQRGVTSAMGERIGMLKTAIHADGVGVAAPIYVSHLGRAPGFQLPIGDTIGLEVEVGLVLGKDLITGAEAADAVDHYFLGIEVCGTRYRDRSIAGPNGGLADNMSASGYVIGSPRALGGDIEGLAIELAFAGATIFAGPARHGFGNVLASLVAYADHQVSDYPLKAGTIVTTGSMCGLVSIAGTGHVSARLGDDSIAFDIV